MLDRAEISKNDVFNDWELRGELTCVLCARSAATARGPRGTRFVPQTIRVRNAEHVDAVRRMHCPYCNGRLWLQEADEVHSGHTR